MACPSSMMSGDPAGGLAVDFGCQLVASVSLPSGFSVWSLCVGYFGLPPDMVIGFQGLMSQEEESQEKPYFLLQLRP